MAEFWSTANSQPKRQYRWFMSIGGIPQWLIKKVNKPSFTVSEGKHSYLNHTFYYPGRVEYEKTSITLVDPVSPDASALMWSILFSSGYGIPDNPNDMVTMNKSDSVAALGGVSISQLNGHGTAIERITFQNPWIAGAKFGDLDYEGDNLIDLTLDLRYDFVTIQVADEEYKNLGTVAAELTEAGAATGPEGSAGAIPTEGRTSPLDVAPLTT